MDVWMQRKAIDNSTFGNESDIGQAVSDWTEDYNNTHKLTKDNNNNNNIDKHINNNKKNNFKSHVNFNNNDNFKNNNHPDFRFKLQHNNENFFRFNHNDNNHHNDIVKVIHKTVVVHDRDKYKKKYVFIFNLHGTFLDIHSTVYIDV